MTITLIVVLLALLVSPFLFKSQKGLHNAVIVLLSLVGIVAVGWNSYRQMSEKEVPAGTQTYELNYAIGWKLGQILATDFPQGGKVLAFQASTGSDGVTRVGQAQVEGVQAGIGEVPLTLTWATPSGNEGGFGGPGVEFPAAEAVEAIEANSDAVALVSFLPLPMTEVTGTTKMPLYILDSMKDESWVGAVERGAVKAVVRPRADTKPFDVTRVRSDPARAFNATFEVVRD